jgi:hypothetical protein
MRILGWHHRTQGMEHSMPRATHFAHRRDGFFRGREEKFTADWVCRYSLSHRSVEQQGKAMAIVIKDSQMEHLARQMAAAEGVPVSEVLRQSLLSLAGLRGLVPARQAPLRERLAALAREVDATPAHVPSDRRSDDEILGYNEHGAW